MMQDDFMVVNPLDIPRPLRPPENEPEEEGQQGVIRVTGRAYKRAYILAKRNPYPDRVAKSDAVLGECRPLERYVSEWLETNWPGRPTGTDVAPLPTPHEVIIPGFPLVGIQDLEEGWWAQAVARAACHDGLRQEPHERVIFWLGMTLFDGHCCWFYGGNLDGALALRNGVYIKFAKRAIRVGKPRQMRL